ARSPAGQRRGRPSGVALRGAERDFPRGALRRGGRGRDRCRVGWHHLALRQQEGRARQAVSRQPRDSDLALWRNRDGGALWLVLGAAVLELPGGTARRRRPAPAQRAALVAPRSSHAFQKLVISSGSPSDTRKWLSSGGKGRPTAIRRVSSWASSG